MKIEGKICPSTSPIEECQTIQLMLDDPQKQLSQIDYTEYAPFWGVAFSTVLFLWLFSHGIGHILKLVKHA